MFIILQTLQIIYTRKVHSRDIMVHMYVVRTYITYICILLYASIF